MGKHSTMLVSNMFLMIVGTECVHSFCLNGCLVYYECISYQYSGEVGPDCALLIHMWKDRLHVALCLS